MGKSGRALWTQKIVEGKTIAPSKSGVWTQKDIAAVKNSTAGEERKRANAKRNMAGRQICGMVLGIDPSLRGTGLSVIESRADGSLRYVESRTIANHPKMSMAQCLARIFEETAGIISRHGPVCAAIEQTVYVQNFKTAMILGSSRGAAIAAVASAELEVFEYPPLRIKQAVIGYGRASKEQIARSISALVNGAPILPLDEADASGAAIAHIFTHKI